VLGNARREKVSLGLEEKKEIVAELTAVADSAQSVIAADYTGISVSEMTELRREARNNGVHLRVVRNTLVRRALEQTQFACMADSLAGPLLFAFSEEDPAAGARVLRDFQKATKKLTVKLVALNGKLLEPDAIEALAMLPTRDEAISMLMAVMKAPIGKLARTLAEPGAKLVRTIAAVRDQKQAA
jgi:large subunit ribosomal protein L10